MLTLTECNAGIDGSRTQEIGARAVWIIELPAVA